MAYACCAFFSYQIKLVKPGQSEGVNEVVFAVMGDRMGHGIAADGRRFEAPRTPTSVQVKTLNWRFAHDG